MRCARAERGGCRADARSRSRAQAQGRAEAHPAPQGRARTSADAGRADPRAGAAHVGQTREELVDAWSAIDVGARERKLADGLRKLVDDGLEFEIAVDTDPVALRKEVFELAAARRRELEEDARVRPRRALGRGRGEAHELAPDADRARALRRPEERARAPRGEVRRRRRRWWRATISSRRGRSCSARCVSPRHVHGATPGAMRALFRKLKFFRALLHDPSRRPTAPFRIEIDGPFSLFESVTKYGLALAIALPAMTACGRWTLGRRRALGPARTPLVFRLEGDARRTATTCPTRLPEEVETLAARASMVATARGAAARRTR